MLASTPFFAMRRQKYSQLLRGKKPFTRAQ